MSPTTASTAKIRADFDRIAALDRADGTTSTLYHDLLLREVPAGCGEAVDVGCGTGLFARELAHRARHVTGIDFSPAMIALARERSAGIPNLEFVEADIQHRPLEPGRYDYVASITTLHHLPARDTLASFAAALRPGGVLAILDVRTSRGVPELVASLLAYSLTGMERLWRTGRVLPPAEIRHAWNAHGRDETYLTFAEAVELARAVLPGARVTRHLQWRYSMIWRKP